MSHQLNQFFPLNINNESDCDIYVIKSNQEVNSIRF